MTSVEMYTTRTCPSCVRAKRLLQARGVEVVEIDVSDDRSGMVERTGNMTVPQIVINGTCIGGYDDLMLLQRSGRLEQMLGQVV